MEKGEVKEVAMKFGKTSSDTGAVIQKPKQHKFVISHDEGTKELLDNIQWLEQVVIVQMPISKGDIVRKGLELYAKDIDYDNLKIKYAEGLKKVAASKIKT